LSDPNTITQHEVSEWTFHSSTAYADPFNEIEVEGLISGPGGQSWRVPAFWAGGGEWRLRFAPPVPGDYTLTTACTDAANAGLHGQTLHRRAQPGGGRNALWARGPLRVAANRRALEHADGTPFFWMGDTWWMGLCRRFRWPEDFQMLTADRVEKGFSLVQIVAGLYPDMPGFDPRGANEAGFPWEAGYARLNPAYFDRADARMAALVQAGLVPCIVGSWGYYLPILGQRKIQQHWRNLIARWGAYPVVWCLAGEAASPYYLSTDRAGDIKMQVDGWIDIARYIRQIDPWQRVLTVHAAPEICDRARAERLIDVDLIEPAHGGEEILISSVNLIEQAYAKQPPMPALIDEISYEGILHYSGAEVQRFGFWTGMLSGAAGHTYGANGLWQFNTRAEPFGASPWGGNWGNLPWDEAADLPGSAQLGLARRLLERFDWSRFEPHQDWVDPAGSPEHIKWPFAAGIPGVVRVIYLYFPNFPDYQPSVQQLEPGAAYTAYFWDPRTGDQHPLGKIEPDAAGAWRIPMQPTLTDWVLVLER
jgi:hypothetical protein